MYLLNATNKSNSSKKNYLGLHAFEHEGIQNITALKDQLITANHNQSEAILKRHADVIDRY